MLNDVAVKSRIEPGILSDHNFVRVEVTSKGLSHLVQSCLSYPRCMSKDSARSTCHVRHFFPKNIV